MLVFLGKNLAAPCINTELMESGGKAVDCNCESTQVCVAEPADYEP